jgi:membrane-bound lytic murein transglycosylase B
VLATYPRDEVRGLVLTRRAALGAAARLRVEVGVDEGRAWALDVHVENDRLVSRTIQAPGSAQDWQVVEVDLKAYAGRTVTIRLIQRVLLGPEYASGNAYWRHLTID